MAYRGDQARVLQHGATFVSPGSMQGAASGSEKKKRWLGSSWTGSEKKRWLEPHKIVMDFQDRKRLRRVHDVESTFEIGIGWKRLNYRG